MNGIDPNAANAAAAGMGGMMFFYLLLGIVAIAGMWKVFTKAGKPGWAAIVPIYNVVVLLEITGRPIWWIVLFLVPIANLVILIILSIDLARSFGKETGFGLGLAFLSFVFYPILGFGSATYQGPAAGPAATNLIAPSSVATKQE